MFKSVSSLTIVYSSLTSTLYTCLCIGRVDKLLILFILIWNHQSTCRRWLSAYQISPRDETLRYLYYNYVCVCQHLNVLTLTSPPVLKLLDSQGYLWLPYDLAEVIKLIGERFEPKKYFFFKKILYVIPSALVSFLPYYCHSFRISVIPSVLVSFLPY